MALTIKFPFAVCVLLLLGCQTLSAQREPQGILVFQTPSTTFTETMEYQTFRHDNPLYSTLITTNGERKQLKSGGVIAVVPYPPLTFDSFFPKTAAAEMATIETLEQTHPSIRVELEKVRMRWTRALSVFQQSQNQTVGAAKTPRAEPETLSLKEGTFRAVRISSATAEIVTLSHSTGILKIPIAELTVAQIVSLNRTSGTIQIPAGIARPQMPNGAQIASDSTQRIENAAVRLWNFRRKNCTSVQWPSGSGLAMSSCQHWSWRCSWDLFSPAGEQPAALFRDRGQNNQSHG